MKLTWKGILCLIIGAVQFGCSSNKIEEVNIGFIAPLSTRATDLGKGPANTLILAVEKYNASRDASNPKVNLFLEDDKWDKDLALPAYNKLRKNHAIDILFISNSDGTVALQESIKRDNVIAINPLNSDALLSSLNNNTFKIAKSTEATNELIAIRIMELGLKNVFIMHYPNDFMTRAARAITGQFDIANTNYQMVVTEKNQVDFSEQVQQAKEMGAEAMVFLGYKEYGYAMKLARDAGIKAQFFGSTVLMDPEYYDNSKGAVSGTEFCFFTPADGNYILAKEFLNEYQQRFGEKPESIWPPMQAHDAIWMVLNAIKNVNLDQIERKDFPNWLRSKLFKIRFYQGVCGNISITTDGSSRGIYFSMYQYTQKGKLSKIKR